jgi:hypothetical protein
MKLCVNSLFTQVIFTDVVADIWSVRNQLRQQLYSRYEQIYRLQYYLFIFNPAVIYKILFNTRL